MTFTALCCEHSGFYQLQKVRALCELMQSHLCPAMDLILVQPHITRTLPPASSALGVCPDQTTTVLSTQFTILSTQLTLLLQSFMDTPTTPPPTPFRKQLHVLKQASLPSSPISLSRSSPQPLCIQLCWLCGGPLLPTPPLCLYTLVPLSRAREQCPRTQKEGGRWNLLFPPVPPGGACALCLPSALSGCA